MGDPAGIGPEIAVRAAGAIWREAPPSARLLIVGDASVMRRVAGSIESRAAIHPIGEVGEARFEAGTLDVLDLDLIDGESVAWGVEEPACGRAAAESLRAAAALALGGDVDAMASAPLHKAAMRKAGYDYPGQTEFLADLDRRRALRDDHRRGGVPASLRHEPHGPARGARRRDVRRGVR